MGLLGSLALAGNSLSIFLVTLKLHAEIIEGNTKIKICVPASDLFPLPSTIVLQKG